MAIPLPGFLFMLGNCSAVSPHLAVNTAAKPPVLGENNTYKTIHIFLIVVHGWAQGLPISGMVYGIWCLLVLPIYTYAVQVEVLQNTTEFSYV